MHILIKIESQVYLKTKSKSFIITGSINGMNVSVHIEASPHPSLSVVLKSEAYLYLYQKAPEPFENVKSAPTYRQHALQNFLFFLNKANFYSLKWYLKLGLKSNTIVPASCYLKACEESIDKSVQDIIQMIHHDNWIADTQPLSDITDDQKVIWIQYRKYWKMACFPSLSPSTSMIKKWNSVLKYASHQGKRNLHSSVEQPKFTEGKPVPKNQWIVA